MRFCIELTGDQSFYFNRWPYLRIFEPYGPGALAYIIRNTFQHRSCRCTDPPKYYFYTNGHRIDVKCGKY